MNSPCLHRTKPVSRNALWPALFLAALCLFAVAPVALATSSYSYKPDEYVVVPHGLSPDGRFSIAAHGGADETGTSKFHIYFMDAREQKKIGVLEEVSVWLDTGADAYPASWSPDSRHVAVSFRWERNAWDLVVYRIEKGRAIPISGPELLDAAAPGFNAKGFKTRIFMPGSDQGPVERYSSQGTRLTLKWLGATRFELSERTFYKYVTPNPSAALGKFAKCEKMGEDNEYLVQFSAVAVCELAGKNKYRIVSIEPGVFKD
jgi:hypothetical protein